MGHLKGLDEYLDKYYRNSVFDQAHPSNHLWGMHIHSNRVIKANITENLKFDLKIKIGGKQDEILPKVHIHLVYPAELSNAVTPLLNTDKKVKDLSLEPILAPQYRHHIKNKTLFPLMKERKVVFITLLEGERIKGIIADFSRYEITVNLKGGIPVTSLRHSIYDVRDKKGRCFLKFAQEKYKDWEKSDLFIPSPAPPQILTCRDSVTF